MKLLILLSFSLPLFVSMAFAEDMAAESMTAEDKALAENARVEAIKALKADVQTKDALLRQARRQRSPQLQSALEQLREARRNLALARRKPLEEYLADAKNPKPSNVKPSDPLAVGFDDPVRKGLAVVIPYTTAYIPQGAEGFDFALIRARFNGESPTQGFFEIDGEAEQLRAVSDDPSTLEVAPDPKFTISPFISRFRKPGKVTITVSVGEYFAQQDIEIIEIPVNANAPSAEIIDSMGLPTTREAVFVDWPNTKKVDCFIYSPKAGHPFVGEHWTYEKYPFLMLSIGEGKLNEVGTQSEGNSTRADLIVSEPNHDPEKKPAIQ